MPERFREPAPHDVSDEEWNPGNHEGEEEDGRVYLDSMYVRVSAFSNWSSQVAESSG